MRRNQRGLTIAEALVTLGLIVFVLNLTAGLLSSYLRTVEFAGGVDKAMEAAQTALIQVRNEAAQAISVSSPSGGVSATLAFSKVWTGSPTRLPNPNAAFPTAWEPHDPAWLDTVTYSFSNERLLRTSLREGVRSALLADQLADFQVQFLPNQNLLVEISTRQDNMIRKFSTEVFLEMLR